MLAGQARYDAKLAWLVLPFFLGLALYRIEARCRPAEAE